MPLQELLELAETTASTIRRLEIADWLNRQPDFRADPYAASTFCQRYHWQ